MKEYKITKERLKAMAEECPEAEGVLKKGFPEAFQEEWVDITSELKIRVEDLGYGKYYLVFKHNEHSIGHSHCSKYGDGKYDHHFIHLDNEEDYRIEWEDGDFTILKRRGK